MVATFVTMYIEGELKGKLRKKKKRKGRETRYKN